MLTDNFPPFVVDNSGVRTLSSCCDVAILPGFLCLRYTTRYVILARIIFSRCLESDKGVLGASASLQCISVKYPCPRRTAVSHDASSMLTARKKPAVEAD